MRASRARLLARHLVVAQATVVLLWHTPARADRKEAPVIQVGGPHSVIVNGDNNNIVITNVTVQTTENTKSTRTVSTTPNHYVKQTERALRDLQARYDNILESNKTLAAQVAGLQAQVDTLLARSDVNSHADAVRTLQTSVEQSPAVDRAVREQLEQAIVLESELPSLPSSKRAEARIALENADLEAVSIILQEEQSHDGGPHQIGVGPFFVSANHDTERSYGLAIEDGGYPWGPVFSHRGVGLGVYLGVSWLLGETYKESSRHFYMSGGALLGPRLRIGQTSSFIFYVYYYTPVIERDLGRWRAPLVGGGASISYQRGVWRVDASYRASTSRVIYSDGHDSQFLGALLSYYIK